MNTLGGPLPGAVARDVSIAAALTEAWAERPKGYAPRTRHLQTDGAPLYTNRLFLESSPYLRQHAHNPVDWHPWGDEAFETARRLKRPILLSVGYSTCHWCHVMEEESFEDEEIARFINEHYVAIKVDREERPDVDAIYMAAVQLLTGHGGWPMTVWLTPDRQPFFGGTYFPARDGDRGGSIGFLSVLRQLRTAYDEQPAKVIETSGRLAEAVRQSLSPGAGAEGVPGPDVLHAALRQYAARFDRVHGGLSPAPKFPSSLPVRLLLRYHRRTGDELSLQMATETLAKMAAGGMYDHVAGGFHRYSTDARWLVPHFEKMLYDNALLVSAYLEGYQVSGDEDFARVAREILRYVERDMTSPEGAFYSATDADSLNPEGLREEGWFFTWTPDEVDAALDPESARLFEAYYDIRAGGNFEGRSIPHTPRSLDAVVADLKIDRAKAVTLLAAAREQLYAVRGQRPAPIRDDKVLCAWNGLMIGAFARAGRTFGEEAYTAVAARAAAFVLGNLRRDGRLLRSYKDGIARHNAYLDDYAFLIAGLLDLYEATGEADWLQAASELDVVLQEHYEDTGGGGYFMTSDDHEGLLAREKPAHDGAEPSGNSVQVMNLLRLHGLTTSDVYRERAESTLAAFGTRLEKAPGALAEMLMALDYHLDVAKEIVIVSPGGREAAAPLLRALRTSFVPNAVLVWSDSDAHPEALLELVPALDGKIARDGRATAYVCERWVCERPTTDPEVFAELLARTLPLEGGPSGS
jgi:hypothetical protein